MRDDQTVFFVGMHNKPGMQPLDSRTHSGKIVDLIIEHLNVGAKKTNLADIDYKPLHPIFHAEAWHEKHQPKPGDVIVLLGRWVQENFEYKAGTRNILVDHPAAFSARKNRDKYIDDVLEQIGSLLLPIEYGPDDLPF